MQVSRRTDKKHVEIEMGYFVIEDRRKNQNTYGACIKVEIKDNLLNFLVMSDKVGNKNVEVLQDSGLKEVIVNKEL